MQTHAAQNNKRGLTRASARIKEDNPFIFYVKGKMNVQLLADIELKLQNTLG